MTTDGDTVAPWLADLGDGTYRNPVLNADWSDPDAIRVGDDYYLTASSFSRVPGLPILHSRDLVNWSLIGHVLERLVPEDAFAVPRHDCGVWAPSLRHHAGRFWIFWGDPDHGIYQINAENPRGPWTEPHLLKAGRGLIDACPLWDEDGGAYLVHAWAKSRSRVKNRLTGHRMSPDGRELLDGGAGRGRRPAARLVHPRGAQALPARRLLLDLRSGRRSGDRLAGRLPLPRLLRPLRGANRPRPGAYGDQRPAPGAWVTDPAGEDWFLYFQARGAYGRLTHLQPMRWTEDGWPVIGDEGEPVLVHAKPKGEQQRIEAPATDDDFPGGRFGRQWTWTANPEPGLDDRARQRRPAADLPAHRRRARHAHPAERPGPAAARRDLHGDGRTLPGQHDRGRQGRTGHARRRVQLDRPRARPGLDAPGAPLRRDGRRVRAERRTLPPRPSGRARLRIDVAPGARCRFFADTFDGSGWRSSGPVFAAAPWRWVGALLGLFATAPWDRGPAGTAEFTRFRITS